MATYVGDPRLKMTVTFGDDLQPLCCALYILCSADEWLSKEKRNHSIAAITNDAYPAARLWYGPVIVLKASDNLRLDDYTDVLESDMKDIRAFFERCP